MIICIFGKPIFMAKKLCEECKSVYLKEIPEDVYLKVLKKQGKILQSGHRMNFARVIIKMLREASE